MCSQTSGLAWAGACSLPLICGLSESSASSGSELTDIARENIRRTRHRLRCAEIELETIDALEWDIPRDLTVVYFFAPFPEPVVERFIARLRASIDRHPRTVRLIYNFATDRERSHLERRQGHQSQLQGSLVCALRIRRGLDVSPLPVDPEDRSAVGCTDRPPERASATSAAADRPWSAALRWQPRWWSGRADRHHGAGAPPQRYSLRIATVPHACGRATAKGARAESRRAT